MKLVPLRDPQIQFGAQTFFAKEHKGDTCGSNGLPLTPNSIIIVGKSQYLKTIKHPYLCQYLDILRGKHERTIIVSQYCGKPLSEHIQREHFSYSDVKRFAFQILTALNELHSRKIVHRNLGTDNILLQDNGDIKLFNYGLYHVTGCGQLVSFPIMQILYTAPEVYLSQHSKNPSSSKADIWSLGLILIELILNKSLWSSLKLGQRIRKILSLVQCNTSVFERIAREHNCHEEYQKIPEDLKNLIDSCLNVYPSLRPTAQELLENEIFKGFSVIAALNKSKVCAPFEIYTISELYYWWQLAGGDVLQELKKQGLIRSSPPILSLPNLVSIEGSSLGQERNPTTLYDFKIVQMPLDALHQRFSHIPLEHYYPLIHSKSKIIGNAASPLHNADNLPLIIREKDSEYQFYRVILFRRLLYGYPYTKHFIFKEASVDIPPLLRGDIWTTLLGVENDYEREYLRIDKETSTISDKQSHTVVLFKNVHHEEISSQKLAISEEK